MIKSWFKFENGMVTIYAGTDFRQYADMFNWLSLQNISKKECTWYTEFFDITEEIKMHFLLKFS